MRPSGPHTRSVTSPSLSFFLSFSYIYIYIYIYILIKIIIISGVKIRVVVLHSKGKLGRKEKSLNGAEVASG